MGAVSEPLAKPMASENGNANVYPVSQQCQGAGKLVVSIARYWTEVSLEQPELAATDPSVFSQNVGCQTDYQRGTRVVSKEALLSATMLKLAVTSQEEVSMVALQLQVSTISHQLAAKSTAFPCSEGLAYYWPFEISLQPASLIAYLRLH